MNLFWLWALLLAGCASLLLLWPLLRPLLRPRRFSSASVSRDEVNVALYTGRLTELEAMRSSGEITPQEYAQLELEAQQGLLLDTAAGVSSAGEAATNGATTTAQAKRGPLLFAALLVPLVTLFLFADFGLGLGSVSDWQLSEQLAQETPADPHNNTDYRQLVEQLAAKMATQPEQVEGQLLLARSWSRLQEPARAAAIYEQLLGRFPQDLTLATLYAEALFAADGQQLTPRVAKAVAAALKLKPDTGRVIRVRVAVADSVRAPADAVVFVYARAWEGPPAPLAVHRLTLAELPTLVKLDESMAMMQGMSLADFDQVQVIARIATTGTATVSDADYEARSPLVDLTKDNPVIQLLVEHQRRLPGKDEG